MMELIHNGITLTQWKEATIVKSLRTISGSFSVSVVLPDDGATFVAGNAVQIKLHGEPIIDGYVDAITDATDANSVSISLRGRDKTGDLVDCSVPLGTKSFLKSNIEDIAKKLCEPYGILVVNEAGTLPKLDNYKPETGEKIFALLDRVLRNTAVIVTASAKGELVFCKRGEKKAGTIARTSCSAIQHEVQMEGRYSKVTVVAQKKAQEGNTEHITIKGEAKDESIPRNRELVLRLEGLKYTKEILQKRADWEITSRLAAGFRVTITTVGWKNENGDLWDTNTLLKCEWLDDELLIESVKFSYGPNGMLTTLALVPKQSFEPAPDLADEKAKYRSFRKDKRDSTRTFN